MVLLGVVAAAVVICVVSKWWADGLIGATEMIVISAIYGGLVFGLFAVTGMGSRIVVFLLLAGSAAWAIYRYHKEGLRQYFRERLRIHEEVIRADPRNIAARSAMAEVYYQLGDLDSAIAAMELAVQMSPTAVKEGYRLRQWQEERKLRDSKVVVCRVCNSRNIWGERLCRTCRQPLIYPAADGWLKAAVGKVPVAYAAVGLSWVVLAACALIWLPPVQATIVAACGALAGAGWLLFASAKGNEI